MYSKVGYTLYPSMAYTATTIEELLAIMKRVQGEKTLTEFAAELDLSKQYLSNVYNRHKEPSERLLEKLVSRGKPRISGRPPLLSGGRKNELRHFQMASIGGKQRVLVNVILDKSGSMHSKVRDVIGGFNFYLDELAKEPAVDLPVFADAVRYSRGYEIQCSAAR